MHCPTSTPGTPGPRTRSPLCPTLGRTRRGGRAARGLPISLAPAPGYVDALVAASDARAEWYRWTREEGLLTRSERVEKARAYQRMLRAEGRLDSFAAAAERRARGGRGRGSRPGVRAADVLASLRAKLHPQRFPGMSGKMAAIVGAVVGEEYTEPALVSLQLTSDGHALGRARGEVGHNHYLGGGEDLAMNWARLVEVAELDEDEAELLRMRMNATIRGPARRDWLLRVDAATGRGPS